MSANLLCINDRVDSMLAEIRDADADVLLLQEYTPAWHKAFQRELGNEYRDHFAFERDDAFGQAIYSRLPFQGEPELVWTVGSIEIPQLRAVVEVGGREVALYNVHLLPPRYLDYVMARDGQFAALIEEMEQENRAAVLSEDFNFPTTSPQHRALRALGFVDAHDAAGFGIGNTWPVNGLMRYLPVPGLRLDHVYVNDRIVPLRIRTGRGAGSDHRPLLADLRVQ